MSARVQRTQKDLIRRLAQHCDLLEDYHHKGCLEGRSEYLGEIAGKLRLLIYESRTNRPLLLDLMRQTNADVPISIDSPRGKYVTNLFDYVASLACAVRLPSNEMVHLSKSDLVALWAQQTGAAHEIGHWINGLSQFSLQGCASAMRQSKFGPYVEFVAPLST